MNKEETFARFHQVLGYLEENKIVTKYGEVAAILGMKESALSNAMQNKDRRFTEGFVRRFADAYSEHINLEWLLTGKGAMVKPSRDLRPHVSAKAAAGFMNAISEGDYGEDVRPLIPFIRDYNFTIEVRGRSMYPYYREGDILACRICKDRLNPPIGKICVIDGYEGAAVKEITGVNNEGTAIICHSFNESFPDYEIEFNNINQIAVVVGMIRPEE